MDRNEVENTAKYMAFPVENNGDGRKYFYDDKHEWTLLPDTHEVYKGSAMNKHHYTTKYHREHVIPALDRILSMGFLESDFRLVNHRVPDDRDPELILDLDYLRPVVDRRFRVIAFNYKMHYESGFDGLMASRRVAGRTWSTPYHDLFCLPHVSSTVRNLSGGNGKKLLILGDSQMIPSLPVLCCCYNTVTYVDNRANIPILDRLDKRYDDVLVSVFAKDLDYYFGFLQ